MKTFNQLNARTYDIAGSPQDNGITIANISQDLVQALSLFKNAAKRYWTRRQITANLVGGQQDYQMPADFVRATEITLTANGIVYPLTEVQSEHRWNELNVIPAVTIYIPTQFFVKGNNVISVWPAPSTNNIGTLSVAYEPRTPDFSLPDVTGTATVTNASTTITDSATSFTQGMIGQYFTITDGSDGNWYQIGAFTSTSSIELANYYQGVSGSGRSYLIGACPDIPEDYHMGLVYFAAAQFYLKRKDIGTSNNYMGMFQALLDQYQETYAGKTTGVVQARQDNGIFNVFGIPPTGISG